MADSGGYEASAGSGRDRCLVRRRVVDFEMELELFLGRFVIDLLLNVTTWLKRRAPFDERLMHV